MTPKYAKLILIVLALSVLLTVGFVFHEADRGETQGSLNETVLAPD